MAQEENPVFVAGLGRNQARRLVRPGARLAWDAGSGVSAWYSGLLIATDGQAEIEGSQSTPPEAAFHLKGHTSRRFAGEAGRVVVGASVQDNEVNSF